MFYIYVKNKLEPGKIDYLPCMILKIMMDSIDFIPNQSLAKTSRFTVSFSSVFLLFKETYCFCVFFKEENRVFVTTGLVNLIFMDKF